MTVVGKEAMESVRVHQRAQEGRSRSGGQARYLGEADQSVEEGGSIVLEQWEP